MASSVFECEFACGDRRPTFWKDFYQAAAQFFGFILNSFLRQHRRIDIQ